MTQKIDTSLIDLDGLFTEARLQSPLDTEPLLARVFADAVALQPMPHALPQRRGTGRTAGFWAALADALGGKGVLVGLGTAAVAGIVIGFAQPTSLTSFTDNIFAQTPLDDVELLPGVDAILTEG